MNRPMPDRWRERFADSTPLSDDETADLLSDAGVDATLAAWVDELRQAGAAALDEADLLDWETSILDRLGYYDDQGRPRTARSGEFFENGRLRTELWAQNLDLCPERLRPKMRRIFVRPAPES